MNSFGELDNFQDMISWLEEIQGAAGFLNAVVIIAIIIIAAAFYVVTAFKWQFIGRKAGLQKDWMPFVPFARTVYRLSIVEEQWWKMFFLDGWWLYSYLISTIINAVSNNRWATFSNILVTLYIACCLAYNIYWRFKYYTAHNIKPHLSLTVLVLGTWRRTQGMGLHDCLWPQLSIHRGGNLPCDYGCNRRAANER